MDEKEHEGVCGMGKGLESARFHHLPHRVADLRAADLLAGRIASANVRVVEKRLPASLSLRRWSLRNQSGSEQR